jgi:hypothetical protein
MYSGYILSPQPLPHLGWQLWLRLLSRRYTGPFLQSVTNLCQQDDSATNTVEKAEITQLLDSRAAMRRMVWRTGGGFQGSL